ncbi:hypothetical protein [Sporomusa aerivorans]|uniref:hypothetical protein n=1 Tax=Sporomusa aerivorans TaxID=204936 RepID=UPI00352A3903
MWQKDDYIISTDKTLLDLDTIHKFITGESYWGIGRSREATQRAIDNSGRS